jgi:UDP-2-acetamido-2-deoxy-ribo-hexuluronate aminotransferase
MTDYLLDPKLVVALLSAEDSAADDLISQAAARADGLWLYVGAMQTMRDELAITIEGEDDAASIAGQRIKRFARKINWLAALAEDGDTVDAQDPLAAQLTNAMARLGQGAKHMGPSAESTDISLDQYLLLDNKAEKFAFIDLAYQQRLIRPQLEKGLFGVLSHGRYIGGDEIDELERRMETYCDVKHAICVSNGTDALLMALLAANVGVGDEVVTSPFTFAATGEMILLLGAKPAYVDIDPVSYNLDAAKLDAAITSRTKAVIPVSIFGQCADMDGINEIVKNRDITVIEDAAQSFGATYNGRRSGALSDIGCTSFFPSKPLGGYGDSGACFTNDDDLAAALRQIRDHGQTGRYQHTRLGINARMSTFQASVLLCKLELFESEASLRSEVGDRYTSMLIERGAGQQLDIVPPMLMEGNVSVYAQYSVLVNNRDEVQQRMSKLGIPTAVHYPIPLNHQVAMRDDNCVVPICENVSERVMSIPMHPYLTEAQQTQVIDALVASVNPE